MRPFLIHHHLERSAESGPGRTAVVDGDRSITYADLAERSARLARLLADLGVRRGDRVGLYLEKSLESVIGLYAVLRVGAAYVPLDPHAPPARLGYIAGDCGIRVLLTGREKAEGWAGLRGGGAPLESLVVLNAAGDAAGEAPEGVRLLGADAVDAQGEAPPPDRAIDLDLAYILYTSGSTGLPKGVMLSHLNCLTFVDWTVDEFGVTADDVLSSHAPLHFDLSTFDLFAAAEAGAPVALVPTAASVLPVELRRFVDRCGITVWYSVPSVLSALARSGALEIGSCRTLRTILFAGEVFPTKYLRRLMDLLPHVRFANLYGPTETNVCTWYDVPPLPRDSDEPIPIGRAIPNVDVFAVTEDGRRAEVGEIGELYVRGNSVMRGYWGDPERTARALVPDPFGGELGYPAYRTGDLVEERPDGAYRFLGRRDNQVKTRGYRVELGDVETALFAHPAVVDCAVVAVPDELVTNRLLAYVVAREPVTERALLQFCAGRLPRYMLPERVEVRDELPKTSTGKVDRQSLAGAARAASASAGRPAADATGDPEKP